MAIVNYYNEHDPKAAAWLRELIREGHIPDGEIDTRSIRDVSATDLVQFTQCHFFAGISGWSLALRLAGWPDDEPVWTGSCPCQPFSAAGKQLGNEDSRHLWPAFRRLILHGAPPVVIGEQVASPLGRKWLAGVRANLETMGYAVGSADLCAAGVGAPHVRQRLFWVADAADGGRSEHERESGKRKTTGPLDTAERPSVGRLADSTGQRLERFEDSAGKTGRAFAEKRRDAGRLADVLQSGLEGYAGHGDDGHEPGRNDAHATGPIAESGRAGNGMVFTDGTRRDAGISATASARHGDSAVATGCNGFWSAFDLIPCTDGKARRIEPGTFPLAHGIPGRVGLLRGYGNAIVPQVAAQFIQAYIEAKGELNTP